MDLEEGFERCVGGAESAIQVANFGLRSLNSVGVGFGFFDGADGGRLFFLGCGLRRSIWGECFRYGRRHI